MSKLPPGFCAVLEDKERFSKQHRPVIDRLLAENDSSYFAVTNKIEVIFSRFVSGRFVEPIICQWWMLLEMAIDGVLQYNNDSARQRRAEIKDFSNNLRDIFKAASTLADLLRLSKIKGEILGCSGGLEVCSIDLLISAAKHTSDSEKRYRFEHWLEPEIKEINKLRSFDLKYWPTVTDIIDELARQADEAYEAGVEISHFDVELPKQIHKINTFRKYFFTQLKDLVDQGIISGEIYTIANADWCAFFNAAFGEKDLFNEQDLKNFGAKR